MVTEELSWAVESFDLAVAGAGIVGLAHALAAARRGLRVAVVEREARALGASVRNFGFVTVSGQDGATRERALRTRDVWAEVAPVAGIGIVQRGALVVARRPEALAVLEQFVEGPMGPGCELCDAREAARRWPFLRGGVAGALASGHELRVDPREALPRLARWLEERYRVSFIWGSPLVALDGARLRHARGDLSADAIVVAPGAALGDFASEAAASAGVRHCTLQMMRLEAPSQRLSAVLMSDLSLVRYAGFAAQPAAAALARRLERECGRALAHGVHLIVAQDADGALVVGDSHREGPGADPFARDEVDELILGELAALLDAPMPRVRERWLGNYPVANGAPVLTHALAPRTRLVAVTSGTGMSTAFALGEETVAELFG